MNNANALSPTSSPKVRRRTSTRRARAPSHLPPYNSPEAHEAALNSIRTFLKQRISYDAFPVSFRIIVLDIKLEVKKALQCLLNNGVVSAPLWNSDTARFAGMLTVQDIIHLIQWYYKNAPTWDNITSDVESFRLESLRVVEKDLGVEPPPLLHEHPSSSMYEAAKRLIQTHARRLPLLDNDSDTGHEVIVSVLTTYRLLKFISINCHKEISQLYMSLRKLNIGTYVQVSPSIPGSMDDSKPAYWPLATANMTTSVFDVVHMFSETGISAVPILDDDGVVMNLYETVDVITLVRLGAYQSLDLTVGEALEQRSPDFPGIIICTASDSLGTLLQMIKRRRVHRLVVVEGEEEERQGGKKGRLLGIITLSDVLRCLIGEANLGSEAPTRTESIASVGDERLAPVTETRFASPPGPAAPTAVDDATATAPAASDSAAEAAPALDVPSESTGDALATPDNEASTEAKEETTGDPPIEA